jgi:hypothetical protein
MSNNLAILARSVNAERQHEGNRLGDDPALPAAAAPSGKVCAMPGGIRNAPQLRTPRDPAIVCTEINMAWENRDYYRTGGSGGEYLGNPALFFGFTVPFGRWFGVPVRLSFWLLLTLAFMLFGDIHAGAPVLFVIQAAMLIALLLMHDFAHRACAQHVGGSLDEFILWPAGGLVHPTVPPAPWPTFFGHVGGILAHLLVGGLCAAGLYSMHLGRLLGEISWNPLGAQFGEVPTTQNAFAAITAYLLFLSLQLNVGLILINLLPFYWYDGGFLLESILWPWLSQARAVNVTCIIGMVIAGPMCLYSLYTVNVMGMIYWALLFASCYNKRREATFGGTEEAYAYSAAAYESNLPAGRRKARGPARSVVKKAAAERREQEKIDAILAKVHAQGMQSLNWAERRALRKATERQRAR